MKKYRIIQNLDSWLGNQVPSEENTVITADELRDLAESWDKDVDTLIEDLEVVKQEYAVFDGNNYYVGNVLLESDENIDDMEPVWDIIGLDKFPDEPNDWFYLNGEWDDKETTITGYDGVDYATIIRLDADEVVYSNHDCCIIPFSEAVSFMDDDIREAVHYDIAPCSNQEFYDAYCKRHLEKYGEEFTID